MLVTRILCDGKRAVGVEVESGGERFVVEGDEIVLTAGAIVSPQLLMLSGAGPAEHLRNLQIPVVHDLPGVGQNLRDHPIAPIQLQARGGFPSDPSSSWVKVSLAYTAEGSSTRNDMRIAPLVALYDASESDGVFLICSLDLEVSAGEIRLTSSDPHVQPYLDYGYLVDPWDRKRLREAIRLGVQLLDHQSYRDLGAERVSPTDQDMASRRSVRRVVSEKHQHRDTYVRHLQDGPGFRPHGGGGPVLPGARARRAAGSGYIRDAHGHPSRHQRDRNHDCRAGGRLDGSRLTAPRGATIIALVVE